MAARSFNTRFPRFVSAPAIPTAAAGTYGYLEQIAGR